MADRPQPTEMVIRVTKDYESDNANEAAPSADGVVPGSGGSGGAPGADPTKPKKDSAVRTTAAVLAARTALRSAQSIALTVVGANTRDSGNIRKIGAVTSLGAHIASIAVNPLLGATALISDLMSSGVSYALNRRRETEELWIAGERAGYQNRSR